MADESSVLEQKILKGLRTAISFIELSPEINLVGAVTELKGILPAEGSLGPASQLPQIYLDIQIYLRQLEDYIKNQEINCGPNRVGVLDGLNWIKAKYEQPPAGH